MSRRTVHDIVSDAPEVDVGHEERLRNHLESLTRDHGRPTPRPSALTGAAALDQADQALSAATAEAARLAELRATLREGEAHLAQVSRGANGLWVLLGTIVLIVAIIVIGQGVW